MTTAPSTVISNGLVRAVVQLPDPVLGFYRGTRFDWAGIISSLTACGHEFFGHWRDVHDPLRHDCITGIPEEFQAFPDADIDYPLAPPGGTFLRLAVGLLRKPEQLDRDSTPPFERFHTYALVDTGQWDVTCEASAVRFRHTARSPTGLGYSYEKTVRLLDDQPALVLEHRLHNSGNRPIHTHHYNHNIFRIADRDPADNYVLRVPFPVRLSRNHPELLNVRECDVAPFQEEISLIRPLIDNEAVLTWMHGFESCRAPYTMSLHDRSTHASVSISCDRPLSRFLFWATRRTFCPEPYITVDVPCGSRAEWTLRYEFSCGD